MKKKAKQRVVPKARLLNAIEQPLRAHSAQMQGVAHRNERLNALKAAATKTTNYRGSSKCCIRPVDHHMLQ